MKSNFLLQQFKPLQHCIAIKGIDCGECMRRSDWQPSPSGSDRRARQAQSSIAYLHPQHRQIAASETVRFPLKKSDSTSKRTYSLILSGELPERPEDRYLTSSKRDSRKESISIRNCALSCSDLPLTSRLIDTGNRAFVNDTAAPTPPPHNAAHITDFVRRTSLDDQNRSQPKRTC